MAKEAGLFDFDEVAARIADKMVRRHPHVFGTADVEDARTQSRAWEAAKAREREDKAAARASGTACSTTCRWRCRRSCARPSCKSAPAGLARLAGGGAGTGQDRGGVAELRAELSEPVNLARLADEIGDLLFAAVNLARHLGVDGEAALRQSNAKFERRFGNIEDALHARGQRLEDASLDEMEALWQQAKAAERA